jgi:hypothetical protein
LQEVPRGMSAAPESVRHRQSRRLVARLCKHRIFSFRGFPECGGGIGFLQDSFG